MYTILLTFRYLRRRLIPVFALLAVALCTLMVIVVSSVMGGFLDLVRNSGKTLIGDVMIGRGLSGFPHYRQIIEEIEKLPEARSATPVIIAYGLMNLGNEINREVEVMGIEGRGQDQVTQYGKTLYWNEGRKAEHRDVAQILGGADPVAAALDMKSPWPETAKLPAMVMGLEVNPFNQRTGEGKYFFPSPTLGRPVTLTVLPVTRKGGVLEPSTDQFVVVNEFMSGLFAVDKSRVYVPFDVAQKMMRMDPAQRVGRLPDGSVQVVGQTPARCTEIHVRAADGVGAEALREAVTGAYQRVAQRHPDLPIPGFEIGIVTWEQKQADFLRPVENEKGLMTVLFAIISIVAVMLVGVIFYMIVLEKTRDVGILRAIGASPWGIALIFLIFSIVVGTLGALIGAAGAWAIVTHLNDIHAWLGDGLGGGLLMLAAALLGVGVTLLMLLYRWMIGRRRAGDRDDRLKSRARWAGAAVAALGLAATGWMVASGHEWVQWLNQRFSVVIWDRRVYFFDHIPSRVDWAEVTVMIAVAILASLVGGAVPAILAANVDPVESLRYE